MQETTQKVRNFFKFDVGGIVKFVIVTFIYLLIIRSTFVFQEVEFNFIWFVPWEIGEQIITPVVFYLLLPWLVVSYIYLFRFSILKNKERLLVRVLRNIPTFFFRPWFVILLFVILWFMLIAQAGAGMGV